jgi:hypothetical protein
MALLTAAQIARELIHPTKQWHLIRFGDSRSLFMAQNLMQTATEIAWGGAAPISMNEQNTAGHDGYRRYVNGGGPPNPPTEHEGIPGEYVNGWCHNVYGWADFTGLAEPAAYFWGSMAYGGVNEAIMPLLWERLKLGGDVKVRGLWRRHSTGISGGSGVVLQFAPNVGKVDLDPMALPCYNTPVITDSTGSGLEIAEVTIPGGYFDWSIQNNPGLRWLPVAGGSNPDGKFFQWVDYPWLEIDGPGIVYHDHAHNGTPALRWSTPELYGPEMWTEHHGLYGPNQIMWLSHGASSPNVLETYVDWYVAAIELFRAVHPEGPVVLDTVYPSSTSGVDPIYRQAIYAVANLVPGVLVLDTYSIRTFEEAFALGWIDDGVHYNPEGKNAYAADIGDLTYLAKGSGGGMIHEVVSRNAIAGAVKDLIDGGSGAGKIRLRAGTTVIAEIELGDPCGVVTDGYLVFSGFPRVDLSTDNGGNPDNAIVVDSDDSIILSLTAGVGNGYDVQLLKASYSAGEVFKLQSASYRAPL